MTKQMLKILQYSVIRWNSHDAKVKIAESKILYIYIIKIRNNLIYCNKNQVRAIQSDK